jgi:hypothetical protein
MESRCSVRRMRQAMAPRLAIRTLSNMAANHRYRGGSSRLLLRRAGVVLGALVNLRLYGHGIHRIHGKILERVQENLNSHPRASGDPLTR